MQEQRPTTGGDRATSRGKHRPGPGRFDVLTLGLVLANGHTRHNRSADSAPMQNGGAA